MIIDEDYESRQFDCSRGCSTERTDEGELHVGYRHGCCKLEVYNWLGGVGQEQYNRFFEVRFKNTRKGIYVNASGQTVRIGDLVIVESATGHDLGIVTLEGPAVARQMRCKRIDPVNTELKKIYRRAKVFDIEKWHEAIAREQETMIRARQIAAEMGLEMKIGDVEFQGDGTKAIFYYIADGRVDFRQLIKVFAEEFRIRIEMKQIGARQEAGLIGGLGVCGRELCCSNYISSFQSITTATARTQDLSLNPQKLAGQCGKLKCCLNYEMVSYIDAQSRIPQVNAPLEFEDGQAWLMKTDILSELMYFSYDKSSISNLYPLSASEVKNVLEMNRRGVKPESLKSEPAPEGPDFVSAVGDDSISRFDEARRRRKRGNSAAKQGRRGDNPSQNASAPSGAPQTIVPQSGGGQNSDRQKPARQGDADRQNSRRTDNAGQQNAARRDNGGRQNRRGGRPGSRNAGRQGGNQQGGGNRQDN